jgi:ABC-2 type transport system ATP-binding protein
MTEKAIIVEGLTKVFNSHLTSVDHVSFNVDEGEIFGFLSLNGTGKTTPIKGHQNRHLRVIKNDSQN